MERVLARNTARRGGSTRPNGAHSYVRTRTRRSVRTAARRDGSQGGVDILAGAVRGHSLGVLHSDQLVSVSVSIDRWRKRSTHGLPAGATIQGWCICLVSWAILCERNTVCSRGHRRAAMAVRASVLVLILLALACGGEPIAPVAPSASIATPPQPTISAITGVVYESTANGRRPLVGVGIDISVEYQSWPAQTTSGSDGRYTWMGIPSQHKLIAEKAGYSQPCRVPIVASEADQDVYLVSDETLSTTGVPSSLPIVQPTLNGRVFERTTTGVEPIAGASVVLDFTGGMGWAPSASTKTDTDGRYLLCNVVDSTRLGLYALVAKRGYRDVYGSVVPDRNGRFDVQLERQ